MIRSVALMTAAVLLAGCSVLSSPDPVQMYRFGDPVAPAGTTGAGRTALGLSRVSLPAAAEADRILTSTGSSVAYLSGARWATGAQEMFTRSLEGAFLRDARRVVLVDRRETRGENSTLDIDVTAFETRYLYGTEAAPTVVIAGRARIMGSDRAVLAEQTFEVQQPAAENRVSAVVAAYDQAVNSFNGQVVAWTDGSVR